MSGDYEKAKQLCSDLRTLIGIYIPLGIFRDFALDILVGLEEYLLSYIRKSNEKTRP